MSHAPARCALYPQFKDKDSFNDTFGCLMLNTSTKKGKAAEKHAHAKEGHAHAVHA